MNCKHFLILVLAVTQTCFSQRSDTAAARLNNYRDRIFTVFNKCNAQDEAVNNAIKAKSAKGIESWRLALLQCATDGMKSLTAIGSFDGDPSLKFSCGDVLKFYQQLAESDLPQVRDFFIMDENFNRTKNDFQQIKLKKHSSAEIAAYNAEIKKYNGAVTSYRQLADFIAGARKLTLYNWNASMKIFMESHQKKR